MVEAFLIDWFSFWFKAALFLGIAGSILWLIFNLISAIMDVIKFIKNRLNKIFNQYIHPKRKNTKHNYG